MDQEYIIDRHRKIDLLSTFFGTAGEVTNGIEDLMSCTADPEQSRVPSTTVATLKTAGTVSSGSGNISNASSVGNTMDMIGIREVKENRKSTVIISHGNMFAKKINIGDNFSGFGEYIYKYMDFAYCIEGSGIKFMPAVEVTRQGSVLIQLENTKGFVKSIRGKG
jgi:hypothetical protein